MLFSSVIGQRQIKERLIRTVGNNRISHAQLFLGPEGCGKLALAIAYAQYILCSNRSGQDACGACPSCIKCGNLSHPDLHFVYPVNTNQKVTKDPVSNKFLDEWREAIGANPYLTLNRWLSILDIEKKQVLINKFESDEINRQLNLRAYEGGYKIMIVWLPEKMNLAAANKLLKIIEEPPDRTVFLLVSENHGQILPTIASRTQIIKIKKLGEKEIKNALSDKYELPADSSAAIARLASGSFSEALRLKDEAESDVFNREEFVIWMRLCFSRKVQEIIRWVDTASKIGRERQKSFLGYGLRIFRECLVMNFGSDELMITGEGEKEFLKKFSPFINETNALQLTEEFNRAYSDIERNANPKILFLDLSLKIFRLLHTKKTLHEGT